jgi:HlyD family secretion protein
MSASVDIFTEEAKGVVAVPIQCVTVREKEGEKKMEEEPVEEGMETKERKNKEFDEVVFVMDADTAKMIKVTTGIQDDEFIEVKAGLSAGQQVISGPYVEVSKNLKSGVRVRMKKEEKERDEE